MSLDFPRLSTDARDRLMPIEPRFVPLFCLVLLACACALASLVFACATPFAAFAVAAGAMLPLPAALLVMAAVWIVNQAIGFGALGYPLDVDTLSWGIAIGAAALVATAASKVVLRSQPRTGTAAALGLALVAAYAAYEIVLFAFTAAWGGAGAFTLAIIARLALLNLLWFIGLVAVCAVLHVLTALRRRPALS